MARKPVNPFLQALYGALRSNISQNIEERGILFTCMDPRLNHMLGVVWNDQFTIRHAGGFVSKPGTSLNVDNAFKLALNANLRHVITLTHTDCLAVRASHPETNAVNDPIILQAWEDESNTRQCAEHAAERALKISMESVAEHGWEEPVYGLKFDSSDETLAIFAKTQNRFITPDSNGKNIVALAEEIGVPQWLLTRIVTHNDHIHAIAKR